MTAESVKIPAGMSSTRMWARNTRAVIRELWLQGRYFEIIQCVGLSLFILCNLVTLQLEDYFLHSVLSRVRTDNIVFILGHPRSATTSLHHAVLKCDGSCASTYYDILFPSVIMKFLMLPLRYIFDWTMRAKFDSPNHRISLSEPPEEHFWLLLCMKSALIFSILFPSLSSNSELITELLTLDEHDWALFVKCLQRSIYWCRSNDHGVYVARPLMLTMYLPKLRELFPKAKFLLCVRNPVDAIASFAELSAVATRSRLCSPRFKAHMKVYFQNVSSPGIRQLASEVKGMFSRRSEKEEAAKVLDDSHREAAASMEGQSMIVSFTAWASNQSLVMHRVCDFIGVASKQGDGCCYIDKKEAHTPNRKRYGVVSCQDVDRELKSELEVLRAYF
eukprot:jgi/Bigna1/131111/aug1.13_g5819